MCAPHFESVSRRRSWNFVAAKPLGFCTVLSLQTRKQRSTADSKAPTLNVRTTHRDSRTLALLRGSEFEAALECDEIRSRREVLGVLYKWSGEMHIG